MAKWARRRSQATPTKCLLSLGKCTEREGESGLPAFDHPWGPQTLPAHYPPLRFDVKPCQLVAAQFVDPSAGAGGVSEAASICKAGPADARSCDIIGTSGLSTGSEGRSGAMPGGCPAWARVVTPSARPFSPIARACQHHCGRYLDRWAGWFSVCLVHIVGTDLHAINPARDGGDNPHRGRGAALSFFRRRLGC